MKYQVYSSDRKRPKLKVIAGGLDAQTQAEQESIEFPNLAEFTAQMLRWTQRHSANGQVGEDALVDVLVGAIEPAFGDEGGGSAGSKVSDEVEKQREIILSFNFLVQSTTTLSQFEHYFRIYPFRRGQVAREDHARNMCELYLMNIYIFRGRLKTVLNSLAKGIPGVRVNVSGVLKAFDQVFDKELRLRNNITHHQPFDETVLRRIGLARIVPLIATKVKGDVDPNAAKFLREQYMHTYRSFMSEWSRRARDTSHHLELLIEDLAGVILQRAAFLSE